MFQLLKRNDKLQDAARPFIAIRTEHMAFNGCFSRLADLNGKRVKIHLDHENLKIGFEFVDTDDPDSLSLSMDGKKNNFMCSATGLMKFSWVRAVTKLPMRQRRFVPKAEKIGNTKIWVIQLCPCFENIKARESDKIPSDAKGIYRYRRAGEIVYIGRGEISKRLRKPDRQDWDFDMVEYSLVENPDDQVKWECYWLERYQEENGNRLPLYNKIGGAK